MTPDTAARRHAPQPPPTGRRTLLTAAFALAAAPGADVLAQDAAVTWPACPVRFIAPYPPGGQTDIVSRWLAERLRGVLPQPLVVDNRAGAQGMIGTQAALATPADGYTVLYVNASTTLINPVIHANPGYDTVRDMAPAVQFGTAALVLRCARTTASAAWPSWSPRRSAVPAP